MPATFFALHYCLAKSAPAAEQPIRTFGHVQIDRADGTVLARLERVKASLDEHQWDEAVETLRQVMESGEGKLLEIAPGHFVNLSDACQRKLAALPPEALKLYRRRIDPVAHKWYEEGFARRDAKLLENVVNQAFASSYGDKALMALGEIRLEEGDFSAARWCWERILPVHRAAGCDQYLARLSRYDARSGRGPRAAGAGFDSGRIAGLARDELSRFVRLHGDARGRLGGADGPLCRRAGQTARPEPRLAQAAAQRRLADLRRIARRETPIAPEVIDVGARPVAGEVRARPAAFRGAGRP